MRTIDMIEYRIARQVDELFGTAQYAENCRNPVTGAGYVHGVDPIAEQKEAAYRALLAREWFAINGPADAQPLPVSYDERESFKGQGILSSHRCVVRPFARRSKL